MALRTRRKLRRPARGPRRASRRRQQDRGTGPATLPSGGMDDAPPAGRPEPQWRLDETEEDETGGR
jgi:hypothetical protein